MGGQEHRDGRKFCGLVTVETTSASLGFLCRAVKQRMLKEVSITREWDEKYEVKARYRLATFRHPVRRYLKRKSWTSALKSMPKTNLVVILLTASKSLKVRIGRKTAIMNKMGIAHVLLLRGGQVEINYYVRWTSENFQFRRWSGK